MLQFRGFLRWWWWWWGGGDNAQVHMWDALCYTKNWMTKTWQDPFCHITPCLPLGKRVVGHYEGSQGRKVLFVKNILWHCLVGLLSWRNGSTTIRVTVATITEGCLQLLWRGYSDVTLHPTVMTSLWITILPFCSFCFVLYACHKNAMK
jgi:hypothetical protein